MPLEALLPEKLVLGENGDVLLLAGLAERESRYLGGVTYELPGVAGGVTEGSSPRRERCVGVRGMSERSSFGRKRGYSAKPMFRTKNSCAISGKSSGYVGYWMRV